jgi:hypothetical protein
MSAEESKGRRYVYEMDKNTTLKIVRAQLVLILGELLTWFLYYA